MWLVSSSAFPGPLAEVQKLVLGLDVPDPRAVLRAQPGVFPAHFDRDAGLRVGEVVAAVPQAPAPLVAGGPPRPQDGAPGGELHRGAGAGMEEVAEAVRVVPSEEAPDGVPHD